MQLYKSDALSVAVGLKDTRGFSDIRGMGIDWHRVVALPIFAGLVALAIWTQNARVIVASIALLAWPFVFIWYGDDLAATPGLHWGLVDRPSSGSLVRMGGWLILTIYLGGIAYAVLS